MKSLSLFSPPPSHLSSLTPFLRLTTECRQPLSIRNYRSTTREYYDLSLRLDFNDIDIIHCFCILFYRMGGMLIGVILSAVLHGICLLQAFMYFISRQ